MNFEKGPTSQSFYPNRTTIGIILNSIKNMVDQGNTRWRIDLVPLSGAAGGADISLAEQQELLQQQELLKPQVQWQQQVQWLHQVEQHRPQQQRYPWQNSALLTVVNSEDLKQKLEQARDNEKMQQEEINSLQAQLNELRATLHSNQSIYLFKLKEERLRHTLELRLLEKENKRLKNKLAKAEWNIKRINEADKSQEDFEKNKEETFNMLSRKLKVTELKLEIREQELQALYGYRYINGADSNEDRARGGLVLAKQQQKRRKEESGSNSSNKKRKIAPSSIESLGLLADQLLHSAVQQQQQQQVFDSTTASPVPDAAPVNKEIYPSPASITETIANVATPPTISTSNNKKKRAMQND